MNSVASFSGSVLFFAPFIYIPFYLLIERNFKQPFVHYLLKIFTVLGWLLMIFYACTTPSDFNVLLPTRNGNKVYVSGSIFMVIVGAGMMLLPLYSKYIKFSNGDN